MDQSLVELNQKIDMLAVQVAYLTEQTQVAERKHSERDELVRDLTPIATEAFRLSIEQLEEIQEYVDLGYLLRLLKRLLRNGRNLERMLDQLESIMELASTMSPLADDAFYKLMSTMAEMEEKGYFSFIRGGMEIMDNIVTSFTEQDVRHLGDNVVLILNTIKDMTQPEIMNFVRNTLMVAEQEIEKPVDISYRGLLRQMRDPAGRRGLALTMRVLHVIGAQADGNGSKPGNKPIEGA